MRRRQSRATPLQEEAIRVEVSYFAESSKCKHQLKLQPIQVRQILSQRTVELRLEAYIGIEIVSCPKRRTAPQSHVFENALRVCVDVLIAKVRPNMPDLL